ncbi:hypothetical protein GCM10007853_09070 [Algimonas ampicilliniresistens]|uniref:Uncharacterized protein n=1 Tax=Algimonas ampicilliniresistens TaxID=1298735 RepID=A0ABQ5V847_9PROT|nr:hypothetical protein [Algimonas ampicilliniresistens]GLQ23033.1 hypothetical protein GCM10007853_09070 [Algimonas ampicilliniresistens]
MTDSDEILILEPDVLDSDDPAMNDVYVTDRRPRWPFALLGGALLGFATAFAASWFIRPTPFDPAPVQAEMAALKSELVELRNRPAPVIPKVDLSPLNRRILALEARPTVEPLSQEIVERMEALQARGFELPEIPAEMQDLSALEDRVTVLETQLQDQAEQVSLLADTSLSVTSVVEAEAPSEPYVDPSSLPRFPANVLRDGATQLSGGGLIRRVFSQHVKVRGSEDPELLIASIERDLADGRPRAALKTFDQLPSQLRTLARGWRADMEDAVQ